MTRTQSTEIEMLELEDLDSPAKYQTSIYTVSFTRTTTFAIDNNYGADADGNRGSRAVFIDEDTAEDIHLLVGESLEPLSKQSVHLQEIVQGLVETWMANNEAEMNDEK